MARRLCSPAWPLVATCAGPPPTRAASCSTQTRLEEGLTAPVELGGVAERAGLSRWRPGPAARRAADQREPEQFLSRAVPGARAVRPSRWYPQQHLRPGHET